MTKLLGWLGTLPFIIATVYSLLNESLVGFYAPYVFVSYSSIILSFLAGTLWGRVVFTPDSRDYTLILLLSNVLAIIAWACILLSQLLLPAAVIMLAISFTLLLRIDLNGANDLVDGEAVLLDYQKLRRSLTLFVVSLHTITLFTTVF
ncbi:MAG: DUF3429 domain-containing protein [Kangiellaceae bacterium]|jgi:hypothetical protein|nr:DUF3429 domain-containing protein [Kangiellaceae bacterium]